MTTITNTEMLNNIIVILENIKVKINVDADLKENLDCDDFKNIINKATTTAQKGCINITTNHKKTSKAYSEFVKANMSKIKAQPKGSKLRFIVERWKTTKKSSV